MEHSRSTKVTIFPSPSPNICTSMWRARCRYFSTNTPASPKLALPCLHVHTVTAAVRAFKCLNVCCEVARLCVSTSTAYLETAEHVTQNDAASLRSHSVAQHDSACLGSPQISAAWPSKPQHAKVYKQRRKTHSLQDKKTAVLVLGQAVSIAELIRECVVTCQLSQSS